MKKIIEKYLFSIIICFLFIAAVPVAVSAQENTNTSTKNVFKELYMIRKNLTVWRRINLEMHSD